MALGELNRVESSSRDAGCRELFENALKAFRNAEENFGSKSKFYRLAGQTLKVSFAGDLHALLTPAMDHLTHDSSTSASLNILVWDDASTHTQMPAPPWRNFFPFTRRGDVRGYNNSRFCTAYNFSAGTLSILDKKSNTAIFWTRDASAVPSYETSAPLRTILNWWRSNHENQFVHAAVLGKPNGAVLIAGKGGSGKSTTALHCLNHGLSFISDDYCMIRMRPEPVAFSLYASAKLNFEDVSRFPRFVPAQQQMRAANGAKAVFFLHPLFKDQVAHSLPLRAILIATITNRNETRFACASPLDAFRALALSTVSQLPGAGQESIVLMEQLVHMLPCYRMELGSERSEIPFAIEKFLTAL